MESPAGLLRLEWREGRSFFFCTQDNCYRMLQDTENVLRTHLSSCKRVERDINAAIDWARGQCTLADDAIPHYKWYNSITFQAPIDPFPYLPIPAEEYLGCAHCSYAVKDMNKLSKHNADKHPSKRCHPRHTRVQIVPSPQGQTRRYIQIVGTDHPPMKTAGGLLSRFMMEEPVARSALVGAAPNIEPNKLIETLGYSVHLTKESPWTIAELVALLDPAHAAGRLDPIFQHLFSVAWKARDAIAAATSLDAVVDQLNRRLYVDSSRTPFHYNITDGTMSTYFNTWKHVLAYVDSLYHWGDEADAHQRPCELTDTQKSCYQAALELDWDSATSDDKDCVIFDLVWSLTNQRLHRGPFVSPVASACAILGLNPRTNAWRTVHEFNGTHYSAIIKFFLFIVYLRALTAIDQQNAGTSPPTWTSMLDPPFPYLSWWSFNGPIHTIITLVDSII